MVRYKWFFVMIFAFFISENTIAQKSKRKVLEARRTQLKKDIVYINALLSNTKKKEKNLLGEVQDLKYKIKKRDALISTIKEETDALQQEIENHESAILKQQQSLKELKADYAKVIYNSYKGKSKNKKILFVLASDNFIQAYKRFQYMKQYTQFRKQQADKIQKKTLKIQIMVDSLSQKKEKKQQLLTEKKQEQTTVVKEKKRQEVLLSKARKKERKYVKQLTQFQREEDRVNKMINKLIRDAIAKSRKKYGRKNKKSKGFSLTEEGKRLDSKFVNNRGKLPWPVKKGYVSTYYGKQPNPLVKTATIQSHGVRITTSKSSKARSVFDGEVMTVQILPGNKKAVFIQHGNYITVYKNLEKIFVKTGDKVKTKQEIGTIFTDKITGKTILGFFLTKNTRPQNPAKWIYRM